MAIAAALCATASALAQESGGARSLSIVPSITVSQLLTDNVRQLPEKSNEAITQVSAGLRAISRSGRVQGTLDYALNGYVYARDTGASTTQNTLNADLRADVVDNWFSVDGRASIGQQTISAFGAQSVDPLLGRKNLAEVRTYEITPRIHGRLTGDVDYEALLSHGDTKSDSTSQLNDARSTTGSLNLSSGRSSVLGWAALLSRRDVNYDTGRSTQADTARLTLSYAPGSEWRVLANAGRESTNYRTQEKVANAMWGFGADWSPSRSTRFSGQYDHRFFGAGHQLNFEYRLPRSVLRISSARDVTDPLQQQGSVVLGSAYDLFFTQFASVEADPLKRDQLVRGYLQNYGISPNQVVTAGFLTNEASLQRRTDISYAMQGQRSNFAVNWQNSASSRLSRLVGATGDFSESGVVHQRTLTLSVGHRLTPITGLGLEYQDQATSGSLAAQSTTLRAIRVSLSTALGPRSTASLALRHVVFDSSLQPYAENALIAAFGHRF